MTARDDARTLLSDLVAATTLLTRLPAHRLWPHPPADRQRFVWALPVVGAGVGAIAGTAFWLASAAGLPGAVSALWSIAAGILVTGGLHEDGLADSADALGVRGDAARRLAVMRDSHIGTYGVLALMLSIGLRAGALAELGEPGRVMPLLVAAGAAGGGAMLLVMLVLRPARRDGLGAGVGEAPAAAIVAGLGIGLTAGFLLLPVGVATALTVCVVAAGLLVATLARRLLGGYTGDVLGASQQVCVCLLLAAATALAGR